MQVNAASDRAAMRRIRDAARRLAHAAALARHALARLVPALRRARPGGLPPARRRRRRVRLGRPEAKNRSRCFLEVSVDGQRAGTARRRAAGRAPPGDERELSPPVFRRRAVRGVVRAIDVRAPGREGRGLAGRRPPGRARRLAQRVRGPAALRGRGLFVPHAGRGCWTMASAGVDGNGSRTARCYCRTGAAPRRTMRRFWAACRGPHGGRHLHDLLYTQRGVPVERVVVEACGVVDGWYFAGSCGARTVRIASRS